MPPAAWAWGRAACWSRFRFFGWGAEGLTGTPVKGWTSAEVIATGIGALVMLGAFAVWERATSHPMLNLAFFRRRAFSRRACGCCRRRAPSRPHRAAEHVGQEAGPEAGREAA